jgi:hypothetical protein
MRPASPRDIQHRLKKYLFVIQVLEYAAPECKSAAAAPAGAEGPLNYLFINTY